MKVNSTIASVGLALLVVVSVFPPGMVGTAGAQDAPPSSNAYTVVQGSDCYVIEPYQPGQENPYGPGQIEPHVDVVTESEEFGDFRKHGSDETPTIESVMAYRYRIPEDTYDNQTQDWGQIPEHAPWLATAYWKDPWSYGTYGLWNWSENQESHMFFYDGPEGDSLVIRHDKMYDDLGIGSHGPYNGLHPDATRDGFMSPQPGGGAASFTFLNLPDGEWAYMDDMYPHDMDAIYYDSGEFEYDPDRHTRYGHPENDYGAVPLEDYGGGTNFTAHWTWNDHGTDGGAFRGLENLDAGERITIEPRFNQDAYLWDDMARYEENPNVDADHIVEEWVIRRENGEFVSLDMTEPVTIMRGSHCADANLDVTPNDPEVGERAVLDAGGSSGGDLEYSWDIDGDGEYERNGTDPQIGVVYDENLSDASGVSVRVESQVSGVSDTDSASLTVQASEPPTANASVEGGDAGLPGYHVEGEQLTFDARNSTDNGRIDWSSTVWEFGDGTNATGDRVTHRFDEAGNYTVNVTVTDEVGNTDTATEEVEIVPPDTTDPEASLDVSPTEFEGGREVAFDASGSDDDRGIAAYHWDWNGDGSAEETTGNATETFTPPHRASGAYNVSVTVEDGNGNTANESVEVNVTEPQRPTVHNVTADGQVPSSANITAGEDVDLSVNATDNVGVDAYHWDLDGDGGFETTTGEATLTTDFSAGQDQSVNLRVSDAAGHNASRTVVLNVDPAPVADLEVNDSDVNESDDVLFDASNSSAPSGIEEYRWDFDGDDEVDRATNESTTVYSYDGGGEYEAAVTIVPAQGDEDTDTATVSVQEEEALGGGGDDGSSGGYVGGGGGGGGGGGSAGPPPVVTDVEQSGANAAVVDVRNARSDEAIEAGLPESEVAGETGVRFESLEVAIESDDPHVVFETAASADAPDGASAPTEPDETLAYLDVSQQYLDDGVEGATVEFAVEKSAPSGLVAAEDVSLYRYDDGWERVDTEVVEETDDTYRLSATADGLGTLAVGTTETVTVSDADLAETTVATGDDVTANATVQNGGTDARTVDVALALDGTAVTAETVELSAGETREVTLTATAGDPGTYDVRVGGASVGALNVTERGPADLGVTDVSVNESTIEAGEEVEITATVENAGGEAGEYDATLTLFGDELRTRSVEVPADGTREVTFVQRIDASGTYTAEIGDESAEIEVIGEGDGDGGMETPGVPGFGVGTALVALLACALLARFRG